MRSKKSHFAVVTFWVFSALLLALGSGVACDRSGSSSASGAGASHATEPTGQGQTTEEIADRDDADTSVQWPEPETLQSDPTPLEGELADIFQLIARGRTGAARVRLVKFDKLNPDNGRSAFLFGLTYHEEQKYAKARSHFERAIRLEPTYCTTYYFYGWCLYYLGELDTARKAFEYHLSAQPNTADSHFALGLINLDESELEAAEQRFKHAIELQHVEGVEPAELAKRDPQHARNLSKAHTRLGDVYMRRQQLEQARQHYRTAVELFPGNYKTYYKLYRVLTRLGEDDAAQQALDRYNEITQDINPQQDENE